MRQDVPWCPGVGRKPRKRKQPAGWTTRPRGECPECGRKMSVSARTGGMLPHGWSPKQRTKHQIYAEDVN